MIGFRGIVSSLQALGASKRRAVPRRRAPRRAEGSAKGKLGNFALCFGQWHSIANRGTQHLQEDGIELVELPATHSTKE
jgi:hypothetical protein